MTLINDLTDEEFEKFAKEQTKLYPDLLHFGNEDDIVNDFYAYHKRNRNGKNVGRTRL